MTTVQHHRRKHPLQSSHYQTMEAGRGYPVLFLHGVMGNLSNWAPLLPLVPAGMHAVCLRFPLFDADRALASVEEAVEYVEAYLATQGWKECILCGNSFGGHVALNVTSRQPARIAGLVLSGSSGLFERGFTSIPGLRPSREWIHRKVAEVFFDARHATEELVDEIAGLIGDRRTLKLLLGLAKSAKYDHVADRLATITCPTLLIWGRQDSVTPLETGLEFSRYLPNAEFIAVDHCGHAPMIEHPALFMQTLTRWWRDYFLIQSLSLA